jgi:hypothetical protein
MTWKHLSEDIAEEFGHLSRYEEDSEGVRRVWTWLQEKHRAVWLRYWAKLRTDPRRYAEYRAKRSERERCTKPWSSPQQQAARRRRQIRFHEKHNAYWRELYARLRQDPAWWEKQKAKNREWSAKQRLAAWEALPPAPCAGCGVTFKRAFQMGAPQKYCTTKCQRRAQKQRYTAKKRGES